MRPLIYGAIGVLLFAPLRITYADSVSAAITNFTQASLTLDQAIEWALTHHPDLAVAKREILAVEGQVLQSQVRPNPEIAYGLEDTRNTTRTQSVQLNIPIERGGKRAARMTAANRNQAVAEAELAIRRVEVRAAVTEAFFATWVTQIRLQLAQDSIELAKKATDAVTKRIAAGKISPVEGTKAQVTEANVRMEGLQAQTELAQARLRLRTTMGIDAPRFETVVMSDAREQTANPFPHSVIPTVPRIEWLESQLLQSPTLQRAMLETSRRQALVEVERSKKTPDINWTVGMKRANELQREQVLFGVAIPIPIFDQNRGNIQEALRREDKARDEVVALTQQLRQTVLQAHARLEALQREVTILQQTILPSAKQAYDAAIQGFAFGKFNFLDVLDAQRTYFAAQSQLIRSIAESYQATAEIERIVGPNQSAVAPITPVITQE
jgi:cobalt-zinc-cadmium efflux system outer membrane protein